MFVVLVLGLLASSYAARPGFHDTGNLEWRDCGVGAHWVSFRQFDITPRPIPVPGNFQVTLDGTIGHRLQNQVDMNVTMEKQLLGRYTKVVCKNEVGSCYYDDPCHFLNAFKTSGSCPATLTASGLPCSCPFNPDHLHMNKGAFTVTTINNAWKFLGTGEFHVRIEMHDKHSHQLRGCFETYLHMTVTH